LRCSAKAVSSDSIIGNVHSALGHHLFIMAKIEIEPEIHPDDAANNVWMEINAGMD